MHSDCFKLFKEMCTLEKALPRLWTIAAWKNPWRRAPPINFCTIKTEISRKALSGAAEKCCILELNKLPLEILEMVRDLSCDATFWRYISVLGLAEQVSATQAEDLVEAPINQISFWERGTRHLQMAHKASPQILRLSIDSRGIRRVERLREYTDPAGMASGCFAFIIEDEKDLRGVIAQFKVFSNPLLKGLLLLTP